MDSLQHPRRRGLSEEDLRLVHEQLTDGMIQDLDGYAHALAKNLFWRGQQGGEVLPSGESPESIVHRVVEKLLDGSNRWPRERVSLFTYLKKNIRRDIHHLARSTENRVMCGTEPVDEMLVDDPRLESDSDRWLESFLEYLDAQKDPHLRRMVAKILEGKSPRDIAEKLNVERSEIYNAQKRLRRVMIAFQNSRRREEKINEQG